MNFPKDSPKVYEKKVLAGSRMQNKEASINRGLLLPTLSLQVFSPFKKKGL